MRVWNSLLITSVGAVSPIEKVVQILTDMKASGEAELKSEQVEAAKFSQNCQDTQSRLEKEMGDLKDSISNEEAKIQKAEAASDGLQAEIAALAEETRLDAADLKAAQNVRKLETTDFLATSQDYGESLDALGRAVSLLSSKQVTNEEVVALQTSLLQIKSTSRSAAKAVSSMVSGLRSSQPQGTSYGYQSAMDGVITMLKDLQDKFKGELHALVQEETSAKQAFEVLKEGMIRKMKDDKAQSIRKTEAKTDAEAKGAAAEGEKASLTDDLRATKQDYRETKSSCLRNNALYAKQDKLRSDEIDAIQKAIDIMQGAAVGSAAGNIAYHGEEAEAFIQLGSISDSAAKDKIVSLLSTKSTQFKSKILSALSMRIQASPFKKVLKMIREMISTLNEQAVKEAEAHGWCEAKKAETKIDLEDKLNQQTELTTEQEGLTAKKDELTTDISTLAKEIANLSRDRGEATKTRAENKAENTKVIQESIEGQNAVANAIQVLNEFYSQGAEHAAGDSGEGAVTGVYGGQQSQSSGVIDIMKVIESDFAREEAQRTATEAQQSDSFKKLMNSSEVDVEVKKSTKQHKKKVLGDTKRELNRVSGELTDMKEQVSAAQNLSEDITKQCSAQVTFEERQEMRENEIQSLKEALTILRNVN